MILETTAGTCTAVQDGDDPDLAKVTGHKAALQSLLDGIEMSGGGSLSLDGVVYNSAYVGSVVVSKEQLALWVQFEILNYLTYTEMPDGNEAPH